mmetsp:Transcript_58119/g.136267  ORF Transcript_58119/g.136267 Transcript_58119/m.136267 type:complete len:204 (+) Transcript_58119:1177-1788(+)
MCREYGACGACGGGHRRGVGCAELLQLESLFPRSSDRGGSSRRRLPLDAGDAVRAIRPISLPGRPADEAGRLGTDLASRWRQPLFPRAFRCYGGDGAHLHDNIRHGRRAGRRTLHRTPPRIIFGGDGLVRGPSCWYGLQVVSLRGGRQDPRCLSCYLDGPACNCWHLLGVRQAAEEQGKGSRGCFSRRSSTAWTFWLGPCRHV